VFGIAALHAGSGFRPYAAIIPLVSAKERGSDARRFDWPKRHWSWAGASGPLAVRHARNQ